MKDSFLVYISTILVYQICLTESMMKMRSEYLEALAVDNGGAALVVLLLGDPHLLEGG